MWIRNPLAKRVEWLLAALFLFTVSLSAGCSEADTGAKSDGPAAKPPAAPAPAAAPAANADAGKERKANRNAKMAAAVEKAKAEEKAKPAPAATTLSSEDPSKWNANDLKLAVARKDPRFTPAVTMRGVSSRGDAAAGAELSDVLAAVTKMPIDGSGGLNAMQKAPAKKKKNSKRGDDDEPAAAAAVPSAVPPGTAPAEGAPAGPAANGQLPPGFKLNIKRN